jgi:hypothetical protein
MQTAVAILISKRDLKPKLEETKKVTLE